MWVTQRFDTAGSTYFASSIEEDVELLASQALRGARLVRPPWLQYRNPYCHIHVPFSLPVASADENHSKLLCKHANDRPWLPLSRPRTILELKASGCWGMSLASHYLTLQLVCRAASSLLLLGSSEERHCLWAVDEAAATSRITGAMLLPDRQVLDMILKEDTDVHASHFVHAYAKWDFVHVLMSLISYATVCFCEGYMWCVL